MAKKKEKTLEEKLQEALVPENQWPYILPENWCWTKGKYILEKMESQKPEGDYFYYIDIDAIDNSCQIVTEPKQIAVCDAPSRASRKLHVGDTIFSLVRPYLKNIAYIDKSLSNSIASTGFYVCTPKKNVFPKFFYWLMISPYVVDGLNKYMKGDNSPSIRGGDIEGFCYPIPPLPEQKRIVYRIESLFAKLDEAKEKIQQVLDGAEMRKAAILHKAFTGELTKTWRKENSVSVSELLKNISEKLLKVKKKKIKKVSNLYSQRNIPHEWTWVELDDIAYKITDGEHATPKRVDNFCGFYLLSARNVRNDELKLDYVDYVAEDEYIRISKRCNPHMGDVLISCSGSVGRCCVITDNEKYVMVRSAAVISPILCNPKFIMYMIMSRDVQAQIKSLCKQTAQANLFIGAIASIKIPLPSLEEQDYIADLVGELFYKEKCSVEHCSKILFDIDTMKKSILAKAFRGELGTNNPTEGSALNLLKEVLQDKS